MYLDFAEDQARRRKPMHMTDWVERLDAFLRFNERNILTHAGSVSHQLAEEHAHVEFDKYETERRLEATQSTSDFDKAVVEVKQLEAGTAPNPPRWTNQATAKKARRKRDPRKGGNRA
jgi:hypothetical protein